MPSGTDASAGPETPARTITQFDGSNEHPRRAPAPESEPTPTSSAPELPSNIISARTVPNINARNQPQHHRTREPQNPGNRPETDP